MLRNNFHIILCMSPVGEKLRIRCRMFPSLVNCCTLIWFSSWPLEALTSVATQYLSEASSVPKSALTKLFPLIHSSVEKLPNYYVRVNNTDVDPLPVHLLHGVVVGFRELVIQELHGG